MTILCQVLFGELAMKSTSMLTMLTLGLVITSSVGMGTVNAQIIELGDDVRVNLSNERRRRNRTNVRVYSNNGRLTVGVEEERSPQTRIRSCHNHSS